MTDYTKNSVFSSKTGTPIEGSDFDSEFDEIATAVASKEDKVNKNAANGYAGLDASGDLADSTIPNTIPRLSNVNVFTAAQRIEGADPHLFFKETDWTADNRVWRFSAASGVFYAQTLNDAEGAAGSWLTATRSGNSISALGITASSMTLTGNVGITGTLSAGASAVTSLTIGGLTALNTSSGLNASNINAGSIGAAYVPAAAVTQHQGSLTISESQITDGSILARIAANETISGAWTFSAAGTITRSGQGRYTYLNGSGNTGGAITLSTLAATGTPANGDIWIQHSA